MTPILRTERLTKYYGNRLIAVSDVHMSVEAGQVFGLLGPNGAGKTTTLKLILGLQRPTSGFVELFGQRMTPNAAHLRQRVGYLPTNPKFPPTLTPLTYLDLVGQLFGMGNEERKPRVASLLRAVDLSAASSRTIRALSTGMLTRLGIAAALMNDPELLIWDEPTSGLDPAGRKYTLDLIRELGKTKTIIVSSHILSDIDRVCDHVGIMHGGTIIYCGSVRSLKETIGRNNVEFEVDGDEERLDEYMARVQSSPEVVGAERRGLFIDIKFDPAAPIAIPLARLLQQASDMGIDVLAVSSTRAQTEDAFLHLLEADQSDGFSRAYNRVSPAAHGVDGAPQGGPGRP